MYRKILIATDGSELASKAVDHGVMLAKGVGAAVIFVTATERWSAIHMAEEGERGDADPIGRYEDLAARSAQTVLAAAKTTAESAGVACETLHVPDGLPAEAIVATANEKGCDLIVMASHGRRGLNRLVLGSQTAEVLAYSKVPVLVLR
jgi:nucleotide-binding universal stress UspA family protein